MNDTFERTLSVTDVSSVRGADVGIKAWGEAANPMIVKPAHFEEPAKRPIAVPLGSLVTIPLAAAPRALDIFDGWSRGFAALYPQVLGCRPLRGL